MSSSHVRAIVALSVTILMVILISLLIERLVPCNYQDPLPVLIAVIAGMLLPKQIDGYLKRRFLKDTLSKPISRRATVSRSLVVKIIGLHLFAIGAIIWLNLT